MTYDKNTSPVGWYVGWYVGSYLLRFVKAGARGNDDPERKFTTWENTVLVKAGSLDEAYVKVAKIGRASSKPYRGGPNGVQVRWQFEGVGSLTPIYEELKDGAEILWEDHSSRKLKTVRSWVKPKGSFRQ